MAGAWEGVGEEEYGLQWDVDRVDLDFKTGGDEDLEDGCGDCGGAVGDDHQSRVKQDFIFKTANQDGDGAGADEDDDVLDRMDLGW